jgi:hypothetical protein
VKEPLGARVVLMASKRRTPFWRILTRHLRPATFWSTWNSVSIRPLSVFALSFHVAAPLQEDPPSRFALSRRVELF